MQETKKINPLETCCYVLGAGAFGIFTRWMQLMMAYNDDGVVDPSFWNIAVIAIVLVAAVVFSTFIKKLKKKLHYLPGHFCQALKSGDNVLYKICRWAFGGIMIIGAAALALKCETDKYAVFYYIVAALGGAAGLTFPLLLVSANRPQAYNKNACAFMAALPILMYCVWLLACYNTNSINPVRWDYSIQILAISINIIAFFRVAGFAFGAPNEWKSLFFCMMATMTSVMTFADEMYLGLKIMMGGAAFMHLMYIWLMLENMKKGKPAQETEDTSNGFEKLR